ncbi:GtrA family protein [Francisella philomiragia]|uniref:GtrA family protein n=1 Tax=Francisella philomiragia TaxID=28110 RepID=UPI001B8AA9F8|nr:GtrA family protein [Francisella philomiragia]QUE30953.1 GtrA family protein [Francisella philomiragia]
MKVEKDLCMCWIVNMVCDFIRKYASFIKFCIIAVVYNLFAYLIFVIFILLDANYLVASTIAFILGVVVSLVMNKSFVFKTRIYSVRLITKYLLFYIFLLCFNLCSLHMAVSTFDINVYVAQIIVIGLSALVSYNIMRVFIFNTSVGDKSEK